LLFQLIAPLFQLPSLQAMHDPAVASPQLERTVPLAHVLQPLQADCPSAAWYLPVAQSSHFHWPSEAVIVPLEHLEHFVFHWPADALNWPAAHAGHVPALVAAQPCREYPFVHVPQTAHVGCPFAS
jgi:hypothetical protein